MYNTYTYRLCMYRYRAGMYAYRCRGITHPLELPVGDQYRSIGVRVFNEVPGLPDISFQQASWAQASLAVWAGCCVCRSEKVADLATSFDVSLRSLPHYFFPVVPSLPFGSRRIFST